jgi:hypothetical protein
LTLTNIKPYNKHEYCFIYFYSLFVDTVSRVANYLIYIYRVFRYLSSHASFKLLKMNFHVIKSTYSISKEISTETLKSNVNRIVRSISYCSSIILVASTFLMFTNPTLIWIPLLTYVSTRFLNMAIVDFITFQAKHNVEWDIEHDVIYKAPFLNNDSYLYTLWREIINPCSSNMIRKGVIQAY